MFLFAFVLDPLFFLFLVFSAMGFWVLLVLYIAYWLLHKRPKKPSPLPAPPSKILRP